jgi:hypothetical protein
LAHTKPPTIYRSCPNKVARSPIMTEHTESSSSF